MNYIKQLNTFYEMIMTNPLSSGQIALWSALMHINNKCSWIEWFSVSSSRLQEITGLSESGISKARNVLKQRGFIDFKKSSNRKVAPKYKIIELNSMAVSNTESNVESTVVSTVVSNVESTALNKHKQKLKPKHNNYIVEIIEYLNEKAGTRYKANSKKTKDLVNARLNEGFTVDDFKTVIDKKVAEWKATEFEKFLRPETLFGNKFEGYLNQNIVKHRKTEKETLQADRDYITYDEDDIIKMMTED